MKKVGIITLYYKNDNYGGIAQAYALNTYIQQQGIDSELISYKRSPVHIMGIKERVTRDGVVKVIQEKLECLPQKMFYRIINKKAQCKYGEKLLEKINIRKKAFEESRERISHSEVVTEDDISVKIGNKYDFYISGSDQIWKPGVLQAPYVFSFLDDTKKRFSYASSITVTNLSNDYGDFMKKNLSKYKWVSVREKSSKKYLENLLNTSVDVVMDPTLLLSEEEWNKVTGERQITDNYLFAYFLGDNRKQRQVVKRFAKKNNLKIVTLPHVEGKIRATDINFGDIELYDVDLSKFLSLIKYADYVCTDSFHAVVFSNIFETNFSVFARIVFSKKSNMNSRLYTLLDILDEMKCFVGKYGKNIGNYKINFKHSKSKLNIEVKKSQNLLKKALEI